MTRSFDYMDQKNFFKKELWKSVLLIYLSIKGDSKNLIKKLQALLCGKLAVCNKTNAVFSCLYAAHSAPTALYNS